MEELPTLADLLDLQDVDLEIDRLLHERQSLPALVDYRAAHELATGLEAELVAAEKLARSMALELDKTNGELELTADRLDAEQNRLYAGGMSARDAEYLRREVEMLDRNKRAAEDQVLELMESMEIHDRALAELRARVAEAADRKGELEVTIKEAWKGIDSKLAVKEARKAEIITMISEDLVELYEKLRSAKDGVAVGELTDDVCGGCHLRLTAAEQLESRQSDPPRCIHCRRILVF